MSYRAPVGEFQFLLDQVVDMGRVTATERFAEATPDVVGAVLTEAGRLCEEVLAPLRRTGDTDPAGLENGVVRTPAGFAEGYRAVARGGWVGMAAAPEHGGMGLPIAVAASVNDMMSAACLALQVCPLLSQGQIEALQAHADPELQAVYLPKLISGEWTGTMNLTEPQAGSDLGALKTRAVPNGDGSYAVTGQKIYISWGDHDITDNICHLVLARLPEARAGTKGISLFLVPKRLPDNRGGAGVANDVKTISLEHKLGLHGAPTAVLQYEGSKGWLVGEPHGGMAAMFTMMNNARLGVGMQGIGSAEGAYQLALAFARDRRQGATPTGSGVIADHADVRRMLTLMKADIFAARAIALDCAVAIDMAHATGEAAWARRAALLTPIAKAFGADIGSEVANQGIQIHGGMGVIEETGAAQFLRDVRVTSIYEGTNGIQAMDLVGRKLADGGEAAERLIQEVEDHARGGRDRLPALADAVWEAAAALREATEALVAKSDAQERFGGAAPYLRGFARVLGGHYHLRAALAEGEAGTPGKRTALAGIYIERLLPEHGGLLAHAASGAARLYDLSLDELAA